MLLKGDRLSRSGARWEIRDVWSSYYIQWRREQSRLWRSNQGLLGGVLMCSVSSVGSIWICGKNGENILLMGEDESAAENSTILTQVERWMKVWSWPLITVQKVVLWSLCPEKLYLIPFNLIDYHFFEGPLRRVCLGFWISHSKGTSLFTGFSFTKWDLHYTLLPWLEFGCFWNSTFINLPIIFKVDYFYR